MIPRNWSVIKAPSQLTAAITSKADIGQALLFRQMAAHCLSDSMRSQSICRSPPNGSTALQVGRDLDIYSYRRLPEFDPYVGCLKIEWGDGKRSWNQRAHQRDKRILELTQSFREPDFPGYTSFICDLGALANIPASWVAALSAVRGVYLLTCPRTREQYVGAAYGADGFWGRWQSYVVTGHGGNEGLRSRDPSDYQISILEVAGSGSGTDDIIAREQLWKAKLQSREMGLNRN